MCVGCNTYTKVGVEIQPSAAVRLEHRLKSTLQVWLNAKWQSALGGNGQKPSSQTPLTLQLNIGYQKCAAVIKNHQSAEWCSAFCSKI